MSDPAHPAPAAAGGGGKKAPSVGMIVGGLIAFIVVLELNLLGMLANQINSMLRMMAFNGGVLLAIAAVIFLIKAEPPKK